MKPVNFYLLRGLARETAHWGEFLPLLEQQKDMVNKVVCIDLPGFGKFHKLTAPLTIKENADFVLSQIDFTDEVPKVIVSISLGSMVAVEILHQQSSSFYKAFVMNTSFSNLSPVHHRLQLNALGKLWNIIKVKDKIQREKNILKMVSQCPDKWDHLSQEFAKASSLRPFKNINFARQLLAASRYQLPRQKPGCPIVVLNSLGDEMVNPECSRKMSEHWELPLLTHPSAGHDISVDDPQWVVEQIQAQLSDSLG